MNKKNNNKKNGGTMHLLMEVRLRHGEHKGKGLPAWQIKTKLQKEFGLFVINKYLNRFVEVA